MSRYGIIGYPLTHTFSPNFFKEKFASENLHDFSYESFPLADISQLPDLLQKQSELKGLNVTIPYKQLVLPFLNEYDKVVGDIGSCNCIAINNGVLKGFNTDVIGFETSLLTALKPWHNKAIILGTGGAAAAVRYVLDKLEIHHLSASRNAIANHTISYGGITHELVGEYKLIINTTPLGMFPNVMSCPELPYDAITSEHFLFDLIYNPEETLFLCKGKACHATIKNGLEMLIIQAEESWKIWKQFL